MLTEIRFTLTLLIISLFPLIIYRYFKQKHAYWAAKGVPFLQPTIPFGNIGNFVRRKASILQLLRDIYVETKCRGYKYTGIYLYARKALFITDPALVKRVLTTDFQYFHDRDIYYDEINDPITANLISLTGHKWKALRAKLTPTFTSGKLKHMFPIISECASEMKSVFSVNDVTEPIEIKDVLARFTTDVIGSCAFGIECNSLKNPNTKFREYSQKVATQNLRDILKLVVYKNFPRIAKLFKMRVVSPEISDFFIDVVKQTVEHRETNNVIRNDFMQLLIQLKNKGSLDDSINSNELKLSMNEIAANAFIFFIAGLETSSTVTSFALFEIALDEIIQNKLRNEILDVVDKHGGKISYDAIMKMEYMERVVQETMRKYPAIPMLLRKCTKSYQMPDSDVIIEEGTPIFISIWGMHSDPDYFEDPDRFNPDRFVKAQGDKKYELTYLPFGDGPRICIGLRFGIMQIKIALAHLLSNFMFTLNEKTEIPLKFDKNRQAVLHPVGGIWLNVEKINKY